MRIPGRESPKYYELLYPPRILNEEVRSAERVGPHSFGTQTQPLNSFVTIHCTVTGQIAGRPGYMEEFLCFWSARAEVKRIWVSLFTPQMGAVGPEIIAPAAKAELLQELERLYPRYPKFQMNSEMLDELRHPPQSPAECIFARTTTTLSADLETRIGPCQFGGNPDCTQCGCIASMGLAAVGHHQVLPGLTAGHLMVASERAGAGMGKLRSLFSKAQPLPAAEPLTMIGNAK